MYLPTGPENPGTSLTVRVRGDLEQARQALLERLTSVDPGLGAINTLRSIAGMQTSILRIAFWVTVVLGGLALVLTVSGLFSVLSYVVEQRAKNIGVRMALGATTRNVVGLVLLQSLCPVGIGLIAGGGLAAALAIVLITMPVASLIRGIRRVKGVRRLGVRLGNWLTPEQGRRLLEHSLPLTPRARCATMPWWPC